MRAHNRNRSICMAMVLLLVLSVSFIPHADIVRAAAPAHAVQAPAAFTYNLLSEGFEQAGFPPPGWTAQSIGGGGAWNRATDTVAPSGFGVHNGLYLAYFNSFITPIGAAARLYTPQLDFTAPRTYTLSFWMYHNADLPFAADELQVEINTGSGWVNVGAPLPRYAIPQDWAQHTVDLSAYAGNMVNVGFRGISAFGFDIHIDDVLIYAQSDGPTYLLYLPLVMH